MEHSGRLPRAAAWRHEGSKVGFEVVFFTRGEDAIRIAGETTAVEGGEPYWVGYELELDPATWITRRAHVRGRSAGGAHERLVERDDGGRWRIDGAPAPFLDGVDDVDLEASAMTNAFPVRRLRLEPGVQAEAPAAYVRAPDLTVDRLEQTYTCLGDRRFAYDCRQFGFACELVYDTAGLVITYPGIARRVD
jgi:hypothetical protein